jgi:hypothetical protein
VAALISGRFVDEINVIITVIYYTDFADERDLAADEGFVRFPIPPC